MALDCVDLNLLESVNLDEFPEVKAEVDKFKEFINPAAIEFAKHKQEYCNMLMRVDAELGKALLNQSRLYPSYAKVVILLQGIIECQNMLYLIKIEQLKTLQEKLSRYEDND